MIVRLNVWVRLRGQVRLNSEKSDTYLVFIYADKTGGYSAKGVQLAGIAPTEEEVAEAAEHPPITIRLNESVTDRLTDEEVTRYRLPQRPSWLDIEEPEPKIIPVDTWVRLRGEFRLNSEKSDVYLVFTYLDQMAGFSAKGAQLAGTSPTEEEVTEAAEHPSITFRLHESIVADPLTEEEVTRYGLPRRPSWMEFYEPENMGPRPWRVDPTIRALAYPGFPDDLPAIFYFFDGTSERMWVRLDGLDEEINGYSGILLNTPLAAAEPAKPRGLRAWFSRTRQPSPPPGIPRAGDRVVIRRTPGLKEPIFISDGIRSNLIEWQSLCKKCGCDLVLSPIPELIRATFPSRTADAKTLAFTTRCPACGQTMIVRKRGVEIPDIIPDE